ncbi:MAG: hypothetical protein Q8P57_01735 [Candidatus Pacearchaeota archaeon]|nr:hypothetical protein [Candidatus Pacearchaeota archaeon]
MKEEYKKYEIKDKRKILEAQKEMVDSFKEYFGSIEVIFDKVKELEKKFNDFLEWRNNKWIVPGKGKTPEQLWLEVGNPKTKLKKLKLKGIFSNDMAKFGLIAHPFYGIVFVPFYDVLKRLFEGDFKKIPDHIGFLQNIVVETKSFVPPFIIKDIIHKNQERTLKLFKEGYTNVKDLDDVYNILKKFRDDWNDEPRLWQNLIDYNKDSEKNKTKKEFPENYFNFYSKEFDNAWKEFFKDKTEPKTEEEEAAQQREFAYWYNNLRKQSDTGKTPVEMGKRIMNFELDDEEEMRKIEEEFEKKEGEKPLEVKLIEKVCLLILGMFPEEEEKAYEKYILENKNKLDKMKSDIDFERGFQEWFLLEYRLPNGVTPMELAFSQSKLFNKKEMSMIGNFLVNVNSLFEVKKISENRKDYVLENTMDNQEYIVETIDFPDILKEGDFINSILVKKNLGNFFFYGNVATYSEKEGQKMKDFILKELNKTKYGK